jgi:hypothetical protein
MPHMIPTLLAARCVAAELKSIVRRSSLSLLQIHITRASGEPNQNIGACHTLR